jgi:hypothetical protein
LKNLSQLALVLLLIFGYVSNTHAGLLIEPLVGFSYGKLNSELSGLSTNTDTLGLKGASYGGRLGYQNFGLQLGLDYLSSNMKYGADDNKFKTSEFGGFIGYELPVLFRVYAGYVFSGTGTLTDDTNNLSVDLKSGSGPKVGIGFTLLPFLDINVEYRSISYAINEDIFAGVDSQFDYNAVMVGLSLPFVL